MKWKKVIVMGFIFSLVCYQTKGQLNQCNITDTFPSIQFQKNVVKLTTKNKHLLDSVVLLAARYPACSMVIIGEPTSCNPKYSMKSWDRVNAIVNYIVSKGIITERLIFNYAQDGEYGEINLRWTSEGESVKDPPPHPNLLKGKEIAVIHCKNPHH